MASSRRRRHARACRGRDTPGRDWTRPRADQDVAPPRGGRRRWPGRGARPSGEPGRVAWNSALSGSAPTAWPIRWSLVGSTALRRQHAHEMKAVGVVGSRERTPRYASSASSSRPARCRCHGSLQGQPDVVERGHSETRDASASSLAMRVTTLGQSPARAGGTGASSGTTACPRAEQPAPVGREGEHRPQRLADRAGQVRRGGVDRDHQVELAATRRCRRSWGAPRWGRSTAWAPPRSVVRPRRPGG